VQGLYQGHPTRIEVATSNDFGIGAVTTVTTGVNVAAADIRNFTRIRVRPAGALPDSASWTAKPAPDEVVVDLPVVGVSRKDLVRGLERAIGQHQAAERGEP
jgi:hypothetical protein